MYSFIKRMCNACPGCALSNPTRSTSSELVYHFPIDTPFWVLFVDGYSAGKHSGFKGSEAYLITACGMTGFSVIEPIQHATSSSFALGFMKNHLRFGLCHTMDKDSKFFGVFKEAVDLLQINRHVLSGGNHNGMLVERVNCYLNKGLKIMTNKCDSSELLLRPSCYSFMRGTVLPSPAQTSLAASLLLAANFNSQSTSRRTSTWNLLPLLPQSPLIHATSVIIYLHSGKLRPSSLTNGEHIIANSSTHVGPTLRFTPLVTQFLLVAQPDLTP